MEEAGKPPSPLSSGMTQVEEADMPPSPLSPGRRQVEEAEDQLLPLPHYSLSSSRLHAEEAEKEEQKPSEIERSPETTMHLLSLTDIFLVSFRLIGRLTVS